MPLYNPNAGDRNDRPVNEPPKALDPDYRNAIVESVRSNQTSLLSQVTGIPIRVNYYRQHLGADEESVGLQLYDINTYQSYELIHNLILKFESKPSFSFDDETAQSTEEGTAWMMADVNPIVNDMFVRDIGDGRAGLYQIMRQPELRSYAAEKVYLITFKLLSIVDQAIDDNLTSKVVKNYYYSKDSLLAGGNALLTKENLDVTHDLLNTLPALINKLYETAYYNPEETIAFQEEIGVMMYDAALARFLNMVIPMNFTARLKPINIINLQIGSNFNYDAGNTVYDALIRGNKMLLQGLTNEVYRYYRTQFFTTRFYGNPAFNKISYYHIPKKLSYNGVGLNVMEGTAQLIPSTEPFKVLKTYFSDGFFTGNPANDFEQLTYDFCFNGIRDRQRLLDYITQSFTLPDKDFVYQVGVLIMMVQQSRRVLMGD